MMRKCLVTNRGIFVAFICITFIAYATPQTCQCVGLGQSVNCSSLGLKEFTILNVPCAHAFKMVDLSKNSLEDYSEDIGYFRSVNLSSNSLLRLESSKNQNVGILDVSKNLIHQIDLGDNFKNLLSLNASENALGPNDDYLTGHCNLVQLDISGNTISSLDAITICKKLSILVAARNGISKLPSELQVLEKLEFLDLSDNRLKSLPTFPATLKALRLNRNAITILRSISFENLSSLINLNLEGNRITTIAQKAFESLTSLEILDLTENKLTNISNENFRNLKSLKKLSLTTNNIEVVPVDAFSDLEELRELDMEENLLTTLPALRLGKKVLRVSLTSNLIEKLDTKALMTIFSGSAAPRLVVLVLNKFRGDDFGWVQIVEDFTWRCADELIPLIESAMQENVFQTRYQSFQLVSQDCPCAFFSKDAWSFGVCINEVPEVNGRHWLRNAEYLADLHDEL